MISASNRSSVRNGLFLFILPILYATLYEYFFGRYGFNPTDQGFILGGSRMILDGSLPHIDFLSIHPATSYILHTFDYLFEKRLYFISGVISLYEIFLYSYILIRLFCKHGFYVSLFLALIALNVNIHVFPPMAWHTIDGILFVALAFFFLKEHIDKRNMSSFLICSLLLGISLTIKQSFFPVFFVLNVSYYRLFDFKKAMLGNAFSLIPSLLYITITFLYSEYRKYSGPNVIVQLLSGRLAYGQNFIKNILFHTNLYCLIVISTGILLTVLYTRYTSKLFTYLFLSLDIILLLSILLISKMDMPGNRADWASLLLLLCCTRYLLTYRNISKSLYVYAICLLALTFSITLSWGYESPAFLSGIFLVLYVSPLLGKLDVRKTPGIVLAMLGLIAVNFTTYVCREHVYRDADRNDLKYNLDKVADELWYIKTNAVTYRYLLQEKKCISSLPYNHIYIYNNNLFAYGAFKRINISPNLWWTPTENGKLSTNSFFAILNKNIDENHGRVIVLFERNKVEMLPKIENKQPSNIENELFNFLKEHGFYDNSERYHQCARYFKVMSEEQLDQA